MQMPVNIEALFQIIGQKEVQLQLMGQQLERLNDRIAKMEEEKKGKKDSKKKEGK